MNQRCLVNKIIALLNFSQTQVVMSSGLMFRLSYLCFCSGSNLNLKCLYLFIYLFIIFLSVMMRICALIEIEFFILMP